MLTDSTYIGFSHGATKQAPPVKDAVFVLFHKYFYFLAKLRIRNFYTGSRIRFFAFGFRVKNIPDPDPHHRL
jgi:hypothetical protein